VQSVAGGAAAGKGAASAAGAAAASSPAYTGIRQAAMKIIQEEGFMSFWKGNGALIIRVR
jgi:hypothetical protein